MPKFTSHSIALFLLIASLGTLSACDVSGPGIAPTGSNDVSNNSGSGDQQYTLSYNGCSTGTQSFGSIAEMCEGLKSDALNNGCARDMRQERFQSSGCSGHFDPPESASAPTPSTTRDSRPTTPVAPKPQTDNRDDTMKQYPWGLESAPEYLALKDKHIQVDLNAKELAQYYVWIELNSWTGEEMKARVETQVKAILKLITESAAQGYENFALTGHTGFSYNPIKHLVSIPKMGTQKGMLEKYTAELDYYRSAARDTDAPLVLPDKLGELPYGTLAFEPKNKRNYFNGPVQAQLKKVLPIAAKFKSEIQFITLKDGGDHTAPFQMGAGVLALNGANITDRIETLSEFLSAYKGVPEGIKSKIFNHSIPFDAGFEVESKDKHRYDLVIAWFNNLARNADSILKLKELNQISATQCFSRRKEIIYGRDTCGSYTRGHLEFPISRKPDESFLRMSGIDPNFIDGFVKSILEADSN